MTNNTIQQKQLLRYEVIAVADVQQRLNAGYKLHGSPVFDCERGMLCQAITMSEPLALQRLSPKKRHIYRLSMAGMKTAEIARQMRLQPRTVTEYLSQIRQLLADDNN